MNCLTVRPRQNWLSADFDRMFDDFFHAPMARPELKQQFAPKVNIAETDDSLNLTFELPGMEKNEIKVTLVDGLLTVSGDRALVEKSEGDHYFRREISSGEFSRAFTLPDTVNSEKITADYKNGLLEIRLAKLEEVKPKEIEVNVS